MNPELFGPMPPERKQEEAELSAFVVKNYRRLAQTPEQDLINRALVSSLEMLVRRRGWKQVFAGSRNFLAWRKDDPSRHVVPDLYLLDDPPLPLPILWATWFPNHPPPRFAVEVVTDGWFKDYVLDPAMYEELGCKELVIFAPHATPQATGIRQTVPLTVFERTAAGRLEEVYVGEGPVWSQQLGVWLLMHRAGRLQMLRLSDDKEGERLIPTKEEVSRAWDLVLRQEQADLERALARDEAEPTAERENLEPAHRLGMVTTEDQQAAIEAERAARAEMEAEQEAQWAPRRPVTEEQKRQEREFVEQVQKELAEAAARRWRRGTKAEPEHRGQ